MLWVIMILLAAVVLVIFSNKKSVDGELHTAILSLLICYHAGKLRHKDNFPKDFFNDAYLFFMPDGSVKAILNTGQGGFTKENTLEVVKGEAVRIDALEKIVPKYTICLGQQDDPLWKMQLEHAASKLSTSEDQKEMLRSLADADAALEGFYLTFKLALYQAGIISKPF